MDTVKSVSVIIPAFNSDTLLYVLKSLDKQRKYIKEIIVIEDWKDSNDYRIKNVATEFTCIYNHLPTLKRNSFDFRPGPCRNMGMSYATGDVVLWLDNDTIPCLWYIERLLEIHNLYPTEIFSANRILLNEKIDIFNELTWMRLITRFDGNRYYIRNNNFEYYSDWYDNTPLINHPRVILSNNLSIRRKTAIELGPFINYFGYGEEDIYWIYKAFKKGTRGVYQVDPGKDIYCCHINHEREYLSTELSSINRLWLGELDPGFKQASKHLLHDSLTDTLKQIEIRGIQSLKVFSDLLDFPDCLKKYIK